MRVDVEQATARDPLRPTLLHLLRTSMMPDSGPVVAEEADALGEHLAALTDEDRRRLLTIAVSLLGLATPHELAALNLLARALEIPIRVVIPR